MTVGLLYRQVCALGFENSLENDERFFLACDRAFLQLASDLPMSKPMQLPHFPLKNQHNAASAFTKNGGETTFAFGKMKAFYFETNANQNGGFVIKNEAGEPIKILNLLSKNHNFIAYKGFINHDGNIKISFCGDFPYQVRNFAVYSQCLSENEADIPVYSGNFTNYYGRKLASDFLAFDEKPLVFADTGRVLDEKFYKIEGERIQLSNEIFGNFEIAYLSHVPLIDESERKTSSESEIDLDIERATLLPLLIASYLSLEDEYVRSENYMLLYRERLNKIRANRRNNSKIAYKTNGW